jgi:hypothetical protein
MTPLVIGGIIDAAMKVIDRVFPDPAQKAAAQLELLKLQQAGEFKQLDADLQLALAQIKVNEVEAASPDLFKSGWRPAVGWTCVSGLVYQFLVMPLLPWFVAVLGKPVPALPAIDMGTLMTLLVGLLGLGTMRTVEKIKGAA